MSVEHDLEAYKQLTPHELNYEFRRFLDVILIEPSSKVSENLAVINPKDAEKRLENEHFKILRDRFGALINLSELSPALKKDIVSEFTLLYGIVGGYMGREKEEMTYLKQEGEGIFNKEMAKQAERKWFWSFVDAMGITIEILVSGRFEGPNWERRAKVIEDRQCEFYLHYGELP